jgi:hypothetical protein
MPDIQINAASSVRAKVLAPAKWPWLHPKILAAWLFVMVVLFLGILSIAAIRETTIECRSEPSFATTVNGDPIRLVDGISRLELAHKRRQCRLAVGDVFAVTIP